MKRFSPIFLPLALGIALISIPFQAQAQQQFDPGGKARNSNYCMTTVPGDTPCPAAGGTQASPSIVAPAAVAALAGTQTGLSIATATALTVPTGATIALIQAQGTNNTSGACLFWRDDGTNPTNSTGSQMAAGASMFYKVTSLPIKLIAASGATCTATISYYK